MDSEDTYNRPYDFDRAYCVTTSVVKHRKAIDRLIGCFVPWNSVILEHSLSTFLRIKPCDWDTILREKKDARGPRRSLCRSWGTVNTVASSIAKCLVAPGYRSSFDLKANTSSRRKSGSSMDSSHGFMRTIGPSSSHASALCTQGFQGKRGEWPRLRMTHHTVHATP